MPAKPSAQFRGRLGSLLVALVSGLCGLFAALPGAGCWQWHEREYCSTDEVERVVLFSGDREVVASESYPELVGATVSMPPDGDEPRASSSMTMTWTVDGVVHSVTWRVESFYW